ncbi:alpha/beta fold hydrolase [Streptomyces sp. NBC_00988]|uniref:thioesterase II family protein n=1 Tax=Streptomyces sp. NBC_00988 TaxID=2903704 RepID=UPI0038686F6D|nr:alpha/beta fold hydrolase [Streptomyces sp. NBC_00988]
MSSRWFHTYGAPGEAVSGAAAGPELRLVCFPHAGGSPTSYRNWQRGLPAGVELLSVCYPGRQVRLAEPPITDMAELADRITEALEPCLDRPLALFGHSMGSAVAYETALRLSRRHGVRPVRLFVSGRGAPHTVPPSRLHLADDPTLYAEIERLGSASAHLVSHHALRELLLPALRADLRLIETYRPAAPERTSCPIVVYFGDQDRGCTPERLAAWSQLTTARAEFHAFPGGHFYLENHEPDLLCHLTGHLTTDLRLLRVTR